MSDTPNIVPFQSERGKDISRQFLHISEIQPCLEANYLIRGWLGAGGLSVLYGPSNSGKTFVCLDMAMHVASGQRWRGNPVKRGPVVYIAAEGGGGIRNRIAAIKLAKPELANDADFHLLPTDIDLYQSTDAHALCEAIPGGKPALVVVDTLARSMGAGDENSARDVAQLVRNLDAIRSHTGTHVLAVHHSGKNAEAGARGSSALRAAVDTEIAVTDGQISCAKQRDMEGAGRLFFGLECVALGVDADGVSSAVVAPADAPATKAKPLSGRDEVAAQALAEAIRSEGSIRRGENFPCKRKTVGLSVWREKCRANGLTDPDASADAQRKAFTRAKDRLLDLNYIRVWDQFVWRVADGE